jgi:RpiB/LacA/LacB family sugar-phosphate isomerase
MLYIASDHGGFALKEQLKIFLAKAKVSFSDLGPKKFVVDDDYPDYAALVAKKVSRNPNKDVGILLCRSGQGVCIVANKFKHVRAALVWNTSEARVSRNDDMSNILCLPSDYMSPQQAWHLVETWLHTSYSQEQRHMRRIAKISKLEKTA